MVYRERINRPRPHRERINRPLRSQFTPRAAHRPPTIFYRTKGPWGEGTGADPLTPVQIDQNFYELQQAIDYMIDEVFRIDPRRLR